MAKVIHAYRVNFACSVANGEACTDFLNGICGDGAFSMHGDWAAKHGMPPLAVWTHSVASGMITPENYVSIAAGAAAVGLAHMVTSMWYRTNGGPPTEEPIDLAQSLWEELGIIPLGDIVP